MRRAISAQFYLRARRREGPAVNEQAAAGGETVDSYLLRVLLRLIFQHGPQ